MVSFMDRLIKGDEYMGRNNANVDKSKIDELVKFEWENTEKILSIYGGELNMVEKIGDVKNILISENYSYFTLKDLILEVLKSDNLFAVSVSKHSKIIRKLVWESIDELFPFHGNARYDIPIWLYNIYVNIGWLDNSYYSTNEKFMSDIFTYFDLSLEQIVNFLESLKSVNGLIHYINNKTDYLMHPLCIIWEKIEVGEDIKEKIEAGEDIKEEIEVGEDINKKQNIELFFNIIDEYFGESYKILYDCHFDNCQILFHRLSNYSVESLLEVREKEWISKCTKCKEYDITYIICDTCTDIFDSIIGCESCTKYYTIRSNLGEDKKICEKCIQYYYNMNYAYCGECKKFVCKFHNLYESKSDHEIVFREDFVKYFSNS